MGEQLRWKDVKRPPALHVDRYNWDQRYMLREHHSDRHFCVFAKAGRLVGIFRGPKAISQCGWQKECEGKNSGHTAEATFCSQAFGQVALPQSRCEPRSQQLSTPVQECSKAIAVAAGQSSSERSRPAASSSSSCPSGSQDEAFAAALLATRARAEYASHGWTLAAPCYTDDAPNMGLQTLISELTTTNVHILKSRQSFRGSCLAKCSAWSCCRTLLASAWRQNERNSARKLTTRNKKS